MAAQLLSREALPGMTWWQWILAPLALGGAAMGGEWLVQTLQNRTGLGDYGHSRSKRLIHLALLFALLAVFAAGTAVYRVAAVDAPERTATGLSPAERSPEGPRGEDLPAAPQSMATGA